MDGDTRIALLGLSPDASTAEKMVLPRFGRITVDRPKRADWVRYLHELDPQADLGVVFVGAEASALSAVRDLRSVGRFDRTRAYVVDPGAGGPVPGWLETWDVEDVVPPSAVGEEGIGQSVELALRAHRALMRDELYTHFYLDMTFNKIFDWFETTRWDWNEVDLSKIDLAMLSERDVDFLTEAAVIEFGTLPGAHNFLREWQGEASFSSWALMWGAEEARHSLVQARYLDRIGIKVRSKHALYKREPYPQGDVRAATLMMNVISEARAAALYKALSAQVCEPVIRRIWKLLGRDEARHCRAFSVFMRELCDGNAANQVAALRMAYIWLADRSNGIKHPAGVFYPHSTSTDGIRRIESLQHDAVDAADAKVMSIIRIMVDDNSLETPRDIKAKLRSMARQP
ncbi:ferritin-like domain-containing protein [Streptomyces sp. ISID311]|uniref:ferritin-like domain-containing protein n=1 Tax=Streptomyces sp. ISID311 TaxID=2601673 RepID=UPI0011BD3AED|nr:ferritin-like domain-containing protein [Streptomyces sp. ISID311]TXC92266.1 ferritin-like domain-containing protein [Streptomyces sp. ISID311]